jgi:phosphoglycolate phosphatase-like HAD superfamily hydrolase
VSHAAPEVVVLDLDNTLVKLDVDWDALRRRLARMVQEAGVEVSDPGIRALMDGGRLPGMETLRAEMERVLAEAEVSGALGPRNAAVIAWLDRLHAATPVSVLSLNSRVAVMRALDRHGLTERVTHVVGREDVQRGKPDPEGMRILAERHGVAVERMLLVGDADTDRLCAERAGAGFLHVDEVGIDWRHGSSGG